MFSRVTPHGAVNSRSPLVSLIFPSMKDKQKQFQEKDVIGAANANAPGGNGPSSTYVKRAELEKIVEQETKRRAQE